MSPARSRRQKKQSFHEHVTRMKEPIMYRPKKSIYMISGNNKQMQIKSSITLAILCQSMKQVVRAHPRVH